ncbi:MAG: hypothetical protein ACKV2V_29300 [Blastocatellia bacterium]
MPKTLKRIILWDYERMTRPYDLLVALIIGTVILVPGHFFGDRDRPMKHSRRFPQANDPGKTASNSAAAGVLSGVPDDTDAQLEITAARLSQFLAARGKSELLEKGSRGVQEALALYLLEEVRGATPMTGFETRLDRQQQPVSYLIHMN